MRLVVVLSVMCLASCASEKLTQGPPAGVDFSGAWKLNEADSDDAQRLIAAQFSTPAPGDDQNTSPSGGQGGSRGGRGRNSMGGMSPGAVGPAMPSVSAMNEGLRWPGKQLEIKQVAAVVAFTSDGMNRICQPGGRSHKHQTDDQDGNSSGRDTPSRRDPPPPHCSWEEKTLIVQGGDPDDDHPPFEEHYSLSDDAQRLVEVVSFKGGRSSGFTMSRVWDRVK